MYQIWFSEFNLSPFVEICVYESCYSLEISAIYTIHFQMPENKKNNPSYLDFIIKLRLQNISLSFNRVSEQFIAMYNSSYQICCNWSRL